MKYRDDSVKHATSPSHRDCPRRGVTLCVFQIQPATPEVQLSSRYAASLSPSLTRPLASPSAPRPARFAFLLFEANETRTPRLRNFDTKPPYPYCYEFRTDNRLESVANAHTAADLHVRPVS